MIQSLNSCLKKMYKCKLISAFKITSIEIIIPSNQSVVRLWTFKTKLSRTLQPKCSYSIC